MSEKEKKHSHDYSHELLSSQKKLPLADRYRNFIISGLTRVLFSRISSLIYILLVSRFVTRIVQDQMILLSSVMYITGVVTAFGFSYSLKRQAIALENNLCLLSSISKPREK